MDLARGALTTPHITMLHAYINDHSRLLDKFSQQADAKVAEANKWFNSLTEALADAAAASSAFVADFRPGSARALVEANSNVRDLNGIVSAIQETGGPAAARQVALRSPQVFTAFVSGFEERIATLEKLVPAARKRLGAIRGNLTEAGVNFANIEGDVVVRAWRDYGESITEHINNAAQGRVYCAKRGEGYTPESFVDLYGRLIRPLPALPESPT